MRVSRGLRELAARVLKLSQAMIEKEGRAPTIDELAQALEVPPERAALALGALRQPVSLTAGPEGEQVEVPIDPPEEGLTERLSLRQQLERLEPRDRQLLELRYFQGLTQARTGAELGMTQVQVSRREKRLLELLRSELV